MQALAQRIKQSGSGLKSNPSKKQYLSASFLHMAQNLPLLPGETQYFENFISSSFPYFFFSLRWMGIAFILLTWSISWPLVEVECMRNWKSEKLCSSPYSITNYMIIDKPDTSSDLYFLFCKIRRVDCTIARIPSNPKCSVTKRKNYRWCQEILEGKNTSLKADKKYSRGGENLTLHLHLVWFLRIELSHGRHYSELKDI